MGAREEICREMKEHIKKQLWLVVTTYNMKSVVEIKEHLKSYAQQRAHHGHARIKESDKV